MRPCWRSWRRCSWIIRPRRAINDAVQDTLTAEEITYDKLVELEKDTQGNVTAVRSNVAG